MAISDLVQYEATFDLDLKHPINGEDLGIVFHVRSAECDAAKKVLRVTLNKQLAAQKKGKNLSIQEGEEYELKRVSACMAGWDWGDQEFIKGEGAPEFTPENVDAVLKVEWIYKQVSEAISDIANFTRR